MGNCVVRLIYVIVVDQAVVVRNRIGRPICIIVVSQAVVDIAAVVTIVGGRTIQYDSRWWDIVAKYMGMVDSSVVVTVSKFPFGLRGGNARNPY